MVHLSIIIVTNQSNKEEVEWLMLASVLQVSLVLCYCWLSDREACGLYNLL